MAARLLRGERASEAAGGMQDLGDFGYAYASACGVSANGSVVVEEAWNASFEQRAFRWTASTGMQNLSTIYAGSLGSDSYLVYANAVSADGLHIVGYGYNRRNNRYGGYSTN
jgi:probable HAF family extracellular repeat protein